ncbi:helix-turn-helix transcriptional regulator [Candidatus Gribaldobacteria bacterium]|nr:helix-turn-helix transcriptional regulator [Candidatus Gribaldobacteria bacterium]
MNKKNNFKIKAPDFDQYLALKMKKPSFKKHYQEYAKQIEIAHKIFELRKAQGISQEELAKRISTQQSNVARIESGQENLTTSLLNKIALAFNKKLIVDFST